MMLHDRVARVICCPGTECCSPGDCYAMDRSRSQLVDIHKAADAVIREMPRLLCDQWRTWQATRGPMARSKKIGERDE